MFSEQVKNYFEKDRLVGLQKYLIDYALEEYKSCISDQELIEMFRRINNTVNLYNNEYKLLKNNAAIFIYYNNRAFYKTIDTILDKFNLSPDDMKLIDYIKQEHEKITS